MHLFVADDFKGTSTVNKKLKKKAVSAMGTAFLYFRNKEKIIMIY